MPSWRVLFWKCDTCYYRGDCHWRWDLCAFSVFWPAIWPSRRASSRRTSIIGINWPFGQLIRFRYNSVGATRPIYDIRGGVETIHYGEHGGYGGGGGGGGGGVRVNVPTRSVDTTYRQVGILTRSGGQQETILPLIGRPLFTNRDKWQFYTLSDKNNAIKLPVIINGKSGTGEYGCNNVSTGDMVYVEGYNDAFRVTAYDSASLRYLPF